jgi:hypothetical protein
MIILDRTDDVSSIDIQRDLEKERMAETEFNQCGGMDGG